MLRQIIKIDAEKCDGCGLCVTACHEGAIGLENGKAVLLRDDYCDGLGNCLPVCPTGAISFEEREALEYNEEEVLRKMKEREEAGKGHGPHGAGAGHEHGRAHDGRGPHGAGHGHGHGFQGCPGSRARAIERQAPAPAAAPAGAAPGTASVSQLRQWPVQIKLVPVNAPYFSGAHLLVSADCAGYAHGNFHNEYMRNRITIIGCPKLDEGDYAEKLTAILQSNDIKSVTVVRMEVPCCGGIEHAVKTALSQCGKMIPWQVVTLTTDGQVRED